MDLRYIERLQEEQALAVKQTDEKISQWERFKSDYKALQERLLSLPDKVTHEVMVPFGSVAFMPGQLVHTNEILVLLGDNWFVDRSAKQAAEIVQRRISSIEKEIHQLTEQKKLLEPRLQFTSDITQASQEKGFIDITEEFDPEKEKQWREQHRKNVKRQRQKEKDKESKMAREVTKPLTDEELWARLDELEIQESENQEFQRMSEDEETLTQKDKSSKPELSTPGRRVKWKDEALSSEDTGEESDVEDLMDSDDYDDDYNDDLKEREVEEDRVSEGRVPPVRITFTHTKDTSMIKESDVQAATVTVSSPGDIYRVYGAGEKPKSILKNSQNTPSNSKITASDSQTTPSKSVKLKKASERVRASDIKGPAAFSGKIIEKPTETVPPMEPSPSPRPMTESTNVRATQQEAPKRVSKFKAQRMKNQDMT